MAWAVPVRVQQWRVLRRLWARRMRRSTVTASIARKIAGQS